MAAEDGLKAQKLLAQGSALGNVGKNEVALKGQKLSISKLLPFQGVLDVTYDTPFFSEFSEPQSQGFTLQLHLASGQYLLGKMLIQMIDATATQRIIHFC